MVVTLSRPPASDAASTRDLQASCGVAASYFVQNQIVFEHVTQPITAKQQLVLRLQA